MEIIDIHTHIYPDRIASLAVKKISEFYSVEMGFSGKASDLLLQAENAGISKSVCHSVATGARQVTRINDFISEQARQSSSRLVGMGTLHQDFENPEQEIDRCISLGLKGIKLHPDTQMFNIDDERMFPVYDYLSGRLPVLFHCGDYRYDYSHPKRLARILDMFPNLTVIAAHFGGWMIYDLALEYLKDKNCYLDTSSAISYIGKTRAKELIRAYGAERVMFGTDYPMWSCKEELNRVQELDLSSNEYELILSANAKRLLNI